MIPFRYLLAIFGALMALGASCHYWPVATAITFGIALIATALWCCLAINDDQPR